VHISEVVFVSCINYVIVQTGVELGVKEDMTPDVYLRYWRCESVLVVCLLTSLLFSFSSAENAWKFGHISKTAECILNISNAFFHSTFYVSGCWQYRFTKFSMLFCRQTLNWHHITIFQDLLNIFLTTSELTNVHNSNFFRFVRLIFERWVKLTLAKSNTMISERQ
jgi:hypothetical protein